MPSILSTSCTILCVFAFHFTALSQGYYIDFTNPDLSSWTQGDYSLSVEDQSLKVEAEGVGANYEGFNYNLDAPLDMSENTKITASLRAESPVTVRIDVIDANGLVSNTEEVKFQVSENEFQTFTFDYNGKFSQSYPEEALLDPTQITGLLIYLNPGGPAFTGTVYFDDLFIGLLEEPGINLSGNLNFGPVLLDDTKERTVTITNTGGADLVISSVNASAGFQVSDLPQAVLSSGASTSVTASFTPAEEKVYTGEFEIVSNATFGKSSLQMTGEGVTTIPPGELNGQVRVNQIGYYPSREKLGVVVNGSEGMVFNIRSEDLEEVHYSGTLNNEAYWSQSGEQVALADFTSFTTAGTYVLDVPGIGRSYPFSIQENLLSAATRASLKAYYFNRASTELTPQYAGKWARAAGHPDDEVRIHASAASATRPENSTISSPLGWYDAGDFGKYIVNGGISVHTLLAAYEAFGPYYDELNLNIPESGNAWPDLLDEVLWELDWMLTMQDPEDGGVYHKLTTANFAGIIMPEEGTDVRYVYYKSTAAALNFAAVMAQAARVYSPLDGEKAATFLSAAIDAWDWAQANPSRYYNQNDINATYDPDVTTGEYGDNNVSDEFTWAGTELYITTQDDNFLSMVDLNSLPGTPSWPGTSFLAFASLLNNRDNLTPAVSYNDILSTVLDLANDLNNRRESSAYKISHNSFYWGSNSTAGNEGMVLLYAYLHTDDEAYLNAAHSIVDYLLGRNATDYSFLTGFGGKQVMNIHHRQSMADGIAEPVPGFIAGGPDGTWSQHDYCPGMTFGDYPAKAFADVDCSYSMTEVTVNWNAPFVFLAGGLEYLTSDGDFSDVNKPEAPTGLALVSATSSSIALSWEDNSDEQNFVLERSMDEEGPFEVIATLDANTTAYEDTDLMPLTSYFYRVKATHANTSSAYSNIMMASTLDLLVDQEFFIDENSATGTSLGTVSTGAGLTFTLLSGNTGNAFALNPGTGELTVQTAGVLNFENNPVFTLAIEAKTSSDYSASAVITIRLNDINEKPNLANKSLVLAENTVAGTVAGILNAVDPEGDELTYQILEGNHLDAFELNESTGELTVHNTDALNYEEVTAYSLVVKVIDEHGLEDDAIIVVTITDVNEAPVIAPQTFQLAENAEVGTVIGTLVAADEDEDELTYAITDNNTSAFLLDAETGELTLGVPFADVDTETTFTVEVSDYQYTSSAAITVIIAPPLSLKSTKRFEIYPNPATTAFKISHPQDVTILKIEIIDASGKVVRSLIKQENINVSDLSSGVYSIQIHTDKEPVINQKLIKQ